MCDYCEKKSCAACTTDKNSTQCLHCEHHDEFTFMWNFCPECGELYRFVFNNHSYVRALKFDYFGKRAYVVEHDIVPIKEHIIFVDKTTGDTEFWNPEYIEKIAEHLNFIRRYKTPVTGDNKEE